MTKSAREGFLGRNELANALGIPTSPTQRFSPIWKPIWRAPLAHLPNKDSLHSYPPEITNNAAPQSFTADYGDLGTVAFTGKIQQGSILVSEQDIEGFRRIAQQMQRIPSAATSHPAPRPALPLPPKAPPAPQPPAPQPPTPILPPTPRAGHFSPRTWIDEADLRPLLSGRGSLHPILEEMLAREMHYAALSNHPEIASQLPIREIQIGYHRQFQVEAGFLAALQHRLEFFSVGNHKRLQEEGARTSRLDLLTRDLPLVQESLKRTLTSEGIEEPELSKRLDQYCLEEEQEGQKKWLIHPSIIPHLNAYHEAWKTPSQIQKSSEDKSNLETIEKKIAYLFCQSMEKDGSDAALQKFRYEKGKSGSWHWEIHDSARPELDALSTSAGEARHHHAHDIPWLNQDYRPQALRMLRATQNDPPKGWLEVTDLRGKYAVCKLYQQDYTRLGDVADRHATLRKTSYRLCHGAEGSYWLVHPSKRDSYHHMAAQFREDGALGPYEKRAFEQSFASLAQEINAALTPAHEIPSQCRDGGR